MAIPGSRSTIATPNRARPVTMARTPLMVFAVFLIFGFAAIAGCNPDTPSPANTPEPGGGGRAEITLGRLA